MNKTKVFMIIAVVLVLAGVWLILGKKNSIEIGKEIGGELAGMSLPTSDLLGEKCENAKARPTAVMLSSDPEARPLAGLGEADLIFEMPVTDSGVTRLMAVFQCHQPKELGSIRSARSDFIPWVQGLGAVYAHWGGEHGALKKLDAGIVDNIDAMKYEGIYYYRKSGLHPPHNGFTSFDLLNQAKIKLGYSLGKLRTVYQHQKGESMGTVEPPSIYEGNFMIQWKYQPASNTYQRWRGGLEEIDRNNSKPVKVGNVVFLKTSWSPISKDYINVKTVGSGEVVVYQNGRAVSGTWEKRRTTDRLVFYDQNHREIKFTIGPIWIETLIK